MDIFCGDEGRYEVIEVESVTLKGWKTSNKDYYLLDIKTGKMEKIQFGGWGTNSSTGFETKYIEGSPRTKHTLPN